MTAFLSGEGLFSPILSKSRAARAAALSVLLYALTAAGAGSVAAQTSPTNNCQSFDGAYWNCAQVQAAAECVRLTQAWVEYFIQLRSNPRYTSRASADSCKHSISNAKTGTYKILIEDRWDSYSPGYWSLWSGAGDTYHTIYCSGPSCPPPRIDPTKNFECDECVAVGNPVHMLTGTKIERATDFQTSHTPLAWERYYASAAVISDEKQVMGKNWRHGYAHRLLIADTSTTGTVVVSRPSGNQYLFTRNGSGAWVTDADVEFKLSPVLESGVRVGWLVNAPDNSDEHYNLSGQLVAVTFPDSSAISLMYASGRLSRVQDQHGRALELIYAGDLLDVLSLPDGRQVGYGYDAQQRLTSVRFQKNGGGTPSFDTITYQYEDPNFANALTGRTDEDGTPFASWGYDTSGRAIRSARAGGVEEVLLGYSPDGSTVTNSLGETVTHTRQIQLGRAKLTGSDKSCVGCGGGFFSRTYDANGYPDQQVDFRNVATDFEYDASGRVVQRTDAATSTDGGKRIVQIDWHADFRLPVERRTYDSAGTLIRKEAWSYNARGQVVAQAELDY